MNPLQARYPEAFEYLRARGIEPSADFYDRVEAARKQAWTMSKLSDLEHIGRIKASLEKAIAEGMSFDNWRKENLADLQGLPKSYQETVFRTTVLSSYNAGRWAHFRDHAERRPILRYTAINDSRTRPAHRALHGLMMPVDDPRWQTLAPPGGFNCRCTLMSLSERQAKGMGYTGAPQDIPTWTDKHGVEHTAAPDKGWNHSPEHDLTDLLREREQRLNMNAAVYDSGDAPPHPEPWHPPLPTAGNAFEEARYDVVTRGQQDGLEHGRVVDANGQVIDTRQGKEQAISYQDIINLLPGTTLYHNHPSNMGLSMADIEFAGQAGLASVVAFGTTQEAAYSVSILSGWSEMYAAIYDAKKIVRQKVSRLFLSGKINEGEAAAMYAHIMALRLSDQGLITYKIAPASKEMADLINRYAAEIEQWRKETK